MGNAPFKVKLYAFQKEISQCSMGCLVNNPDRLKLMHIPTIFCPLSLLQTKYPNLAILRMAIQTQSPMDFKTLQGQGKRRYKILFCNVSDTGFSPLVLVQQLVEHSAILYPLFATVPGYDCIMERGSKADQGSFTAC